MSDPLVPFWMTAEEKVAHYQDQLRENPDLTWREYADLLYQFLVDNNIEVICTLPRKEAAQ